VQHLQQWRNGGLDRRGPDHDLRDERSDYKCGGRGNARDVTLGSPGAERGDEKVSAHRVGEQAMQELNVDGSPGPKG
jgi:hypothetical protein